MILRTEVFGLSTGLELEDLVLALQLLSLEVTRESPYFKLAQWHGNSTSFVSCVFYSSGSNSDVAYIKFDCPWMVSTRQSHHLKGNCSLNIGSSRRIFDTNLWAPLPGLGSAHGKYCSCFMNSGIPLFLGFVWENC